MEHGNVILDLGKTEAILPYKERCPKEDYSVGARLRVYILDVKSVGRGPEIYVSRTHPGLVKKLFELEVPEIVEGTVQIKEVAREPGFRAKIAIVSTDDKVECVGACVGMRGARVKNIVRELNGEKIDIVKWDDDMARYVENSLSPAELKKVEVDKKNKTVKVTVAEDQLALAIGKRGQNARLTAKLTGWKIDIRKEATMKDKKAQMARTFQRLEGVSEEEATKLVEAGFTSLESLQQVSPADLQEIEGIDAERAQQIHEAAAKGVTAETEEETEIERAVFDPEDSLRAAGNNKDE
jgi:N utilization substance protein A